MVRIAPGGAWYRCKTGYYRSFKDKNLDIRSREWSGSYYTIRAKTQQRSKADLHFMEGRTKELRTFDPARHGRVCPMRSSGFNRPKTFNNHVSLFGLPS
jgi:hypothetical protein